MLFKSRFVFKIFYISILSVFLFVNQKVQAAELENVINDVSASATNELKDLVDNYNNATSLKARQNILSSAQSVTDNGAIIASLSALQGASNVVHKRLSIVRSRLADSSGLSAGNLFEDTGFWVKPYGQLASQDTERSAAGYNADSFGVALGFDTRSALEDTILGVSISYSETEVSSQDINQTETDVDTFHVGIYADKALENNASISGYIGYGHSENGTVRHNVGGVSHLVAEGSYESHQLIIQGQLSKQFVYKSMNLTPSFFTQYMMYDPDTYKEEGAGNASLSVDYDTFNKFDIGVALELEWLKNQENPSPLSPLFRVSYKYDLIDDELEGTNIFSGGGQSFNIKGVEPSNHLFGIGMTLNYQDESGWDLGLNYDFEVSTDYKAHFGYVVAKTAL